MAFRSIDLLCQILFLLYKKSYISILYAVSASKCIHLNEVYKTKNLLWLLQPTIPTFCSAPSSTKTIPKKRQKHPAMWSLGQPQPHTKARDIFHDLSTSGTSICFLASDFSGQITYLVGSSWWFFTHPSEKYANLKLDSIFPIFGVKIKNTWNHHLDIMRKAAGDLLEGFPY